MIKIDCEFPGGNILVDRVEGDDIYLHPDMRDTEGGWFYWAFRLRGGAGRHLRFHFAPYAPIGMQGPAISWDQGLTWVWQPADFTTDSFALDIPADCDDLRIAFSLVYTQSNWERFVDALKPSAAWQQDVLCTTRKGRDVEMLSVGAPDDQARRRVLITARHHCCEMIASYTMEGMITEILSDSEAGTWLREHVRFLFIPFVDKDGVEDGDQGKSRRPRDHNRDYLGESVHVETAAIRKLIPAWADQAGLDAAIDLHCPWIRGAYNDVVYQVGCSEPKVWDEQQRLGKILESVNSPDALPYKAKDNLAFGEAWNKAQNYTAGMSFSRWSATLPGIRLSTSFEIPYALSGGVQVTADRARRLGCDMATALASYLREA